MTAAVECDHLVILFQNDVLIVVEIQQADWVEFVRDAAWRIDRCRAAVISQTVAAAAADTQRVNDALDGGVVRWMLVLTEWERTDAAALVSVVALGRDDPAGPAYLLEVNVHLVSLAGATSAARRRAARSAWRCAVDEALVSWRAHVVRARPTTSDRNTARCLPANTLLSTVRLVQEPDVVAAHCS